MNERKPMDEYINKAKAIEAIRHDPMGGLNYKQILTELPAADVVPVVHAKWENYSPITIKCSRCGHVIHDWRYSECKYCPNCGAKMDGGENT